MKHVQRKMLKMNFMIVVMLFGGDEGTCWEITKADGEAFAAQRCSEVTKANGQQLHANTRRNSL